MAAYLIIVEGESDCWCLWHAGYPAIGLPGASNIKCLTLAHVAGFERLIVVSEPDAAGARFPATIADHLRDLGHTGRVDVLFIGTSGFKDPAALYADDPASFRERFDVLLKATERAVESPLTSAGPYEITKDGRTIFRKQVKSGHSEILVDVELANFHARVVEDTIRDDGVAQDRTLTIEARVDSKAKQVIQLPAAKFSSLEWTSQIRGGAVICAGSGVRDRLREAIERLSGRATERMIYTHTGWREIAGEWVYLHGAGGIGVDGLRGDIQAELPDSLAQFSLPHPPAGAELREALKTSASMLDAGAPEVMVPLFAAIWRSALGEADFSIFLIGETGSYKSSLAAVAQRHFGPAFDRKNLPASWSSTANFLENLAFHAKDALLVVDDFRPATHGLDRELQKEAERLFRAQGNRSGRGRLRADGSQRPVRVPRGMILTTAEEFVWGRSLEARMVVLEIAKISLDKLKVLHDAGAAGVLSAAMSAWVQWLAPRLLEVRKRVAKRAEEVAQNFVGSHARTALALGELQATLELWSEFSQIPVPRLAGVFTDHATAEAVEEQDQTPDTRFVELLVSAMQHGRAHVRTIVGMKPSGGEVGLGWTIDRSGSFIPQGITVLWVDEAATEWFLDINAAYQVVMMSSNDGNRPSVSVRVLTRLLAEHGYLTRTDKEGGRFYKIRKTINGAQMNVLAIQPGRFGLPVS